MGFITQNLSNLRGELILLILLFIVCFIITYLLGRGKTVAFILSFYPAIFLYSQFPFSEKLIFFNDTDSQIFLNKLGIFLIFFLITFLILCNITGRTMVYTSNRGITKTILLSLFVLSMILVTVNRVIPSDKISELLPMTGGIFASQNYFFWLLTIPIVFIVLFMRK